MLKRYWIFAVAFGLTAASLQAQEQAQGGQDRAENQEQAAQEQPLGIPVRIIEDDEAAEARERRERVSAQREQDDLVAQQRMAEATEAMNTATESMKNAGWLSFGAVAIGTCLLIWTLFLTRDANKAARETVAITRKMGEAQTRAYLSVKSVQVRRRVPERPLVTLNIVNRGASPAYNVMVVFYAVGSGGPNHSQGDGPKTQGQAQLSFPLAMLGAGQEGPLEFGCVESLTVDFSKNIAPCAEVTDIECVLAYQTAFGKLRGEWDIDEEFSFFIMPKTRADDADVVTVDIDRRRSIGWIGDLKHRLPERLSKHKSQTEGKRTIHPSLSE